MHVVVLPSWYPTTKDDLKGSFFREQAIAIAKRNVQIGVISPCMRSMRHWETVFTGSYKMQVETDNGVQTYRSHGMAWFPRLPRLSRWHWIRNGRPLFERYVNDQGMPDLIHVHSMINAGFLALELHLKFGIPFVITEHSSFFARNLLSPDEVVLARKVANLASRRFAVSLPFCDLLMHQLGNEAGQWEPMPNIVNQTFLDYTYRKHTDKSQPLRFLTIALLTKTKATANLIQAFAQCFMEQDKMILEIGGEGPERPHLEKMVRDLGIQSQVHFLGELTRLEVIGAMAAANVFVLPSHYETFGVVVIEALALGKPVIATRCGGPESIIESGDGLLVPTHDIDSLAQAMAKISLHIESYDPVDIRERCRIRFGEEAIISRLTEVYRDVSNTSVC